MNLERLITPRRCRNHCLRAVARRRLKVLLLVARVVAADDFARNNKEVVQKADQDNENDVHQAHESAVPDGQDKFKEIAKGRCIDSTQDSRALPVQKKVNGIVKIVELLLGCQDRWIRSPPRKAKETVKVDERRWSGSAQYPESTMVQGSQLVVLEATAARGRLSLTRPLRSNAGCKLGGTYFLERHLRAETFIIIYTYHL